MGEVNFSNVESDREQNIRLRKYILDRVCRKYLETGDPTFTVDEIKKALKGLDPVYATIQTWENWAQSA